MSKYQINIGTVSLILPNVTATAATLNCPLSITGSITTSGAATFGTPLAVASGGTGTSTIGTPGQYTIVNAGGTGYSFTSGPGGGGVTSIGLAGNSTFNSIFTITTSSSNPVTNSGILTISVTNFTGTGNLVLQTSPTLTTPNIGVASATSLTASGTVTAATLNATGLSVSQAVFTDGSKNLTSIATTGTGNVVLATSPTLVTPSLGAASATSLTASGTVSAGLLKASISAVGLNDVIECLNPNTTFGNLQRATIGVGSARVDGDCLIVGSRYETSGAATNTGFIGLFGTDKPLLTFGNNAYAEFKSCSVISSTQCWGAAYQATSNSISGGGNTFYLNDLSIKSGPFGYVQLTSYDDKYQNLTGRTLSVLFTYSVFWDPAIGGGVVQAALRKNNAANLGGSSAAVFTSTHCCSCTGSAIMSLANGDTVEVWVKNNLGGSLSYKGGAAGGETTSHITYHILN